MKASDLFVQCLEREGITHIFGLPGEENSDLILSLANSSIRFVLTRHEQGAAFMASIYGRLTGKPAVCLATLGPGATNVITGAADAHMDRAPMIVVTGQAVTENLHKESHQVMDAISMYRPISKWSHAILRPETIPEIICKAARLAREEKPGVVHLELAEDVARMDTKAKPLAPSSFRRPEPDDKVCGQACAMLREAKHPIIIAGNGAIRERASRSLRKLCQRTGIGVMSTFMAKGCVPKDAPYYLYTIGLQQRDYAFYLIKNCDLVITLGYDLVEYPPRLWNPDGKKPILHIDFLPAEIDAHYRPQLELVGDISRALQKIITEMRKGETPSYDLSYQNKIRKKITTDLSRHRLDQGEGPIRPQKILHDVDRLIGERDIVLSGVGAHKMWIARHLHRSIPNTCLIPNGFCSMGQPLPGAIAAHMVYPNRRILGIAGDGDFLMNVQEMETAARLKSNITILVWEDNAYGLIAWKQDSMFGKHDHVSFSNPDWLYLAKSFSWHGSYVHKPQDLAPALEAAFAFTGPSLVVAVVDYRENALLTKRLGEICHHI